MLAAFSLLFGLLAVAPTALIARGHRSGWLLGLAAQVPWCVYDVLTGQPGFLLITAVSAPVYWAGWRRSGQPETLQVTAGEVEHHTWCAVCQAPTRLRIPITFGAKPAGTIECCPGCGANHAQSSVTVTPAPRRRLPRHPLAAAANALHRRRCARDGLISPGCAYGDCRWPGRWGCLYELPADDGLMKYLFCGPRHRAAWAADNQLLPP